MRALRFGWLLLWTAVISPVILCPDDQFCKVCIYKDNQEFICLACQNSYFNPRSKSCNPVENPIPNCLTYHYEHPHKCIECEMGHFPDADGYCVPCPIRCRFCLEHVCLGCAERFIPVNGNCADSKQKCSDPNCSICNKDDKCLFCDNGFSINAAGDCVRSIDYCDQIGQVSNCEKCWAGFYLDEDLHCVQIQQHQIAWYIFLVVMLLILMFIGRIFMKKENRNRKYTEDSYNNLN